MLEGVDIFISYYVDIVNAFFLTVDCYILL